MVAPGLSTSFVGRTVELAELDALLAARRLVTIVGEGGIGKTRLARETIAIRSDWVAFWVDLGSGSGPAGVRASFEDALRPTGRDTSFEALVEERVPPGPCVLVIDNCEHVLDEVAECVSIVAQLRPDARMLATSRTRLGVNGEVVYRLAPLDVPSADAPVAQAGESAAVALLLDRLGDAVSDLELDVDDVGDLVEVARRTEGVPLAIELVAAAAGAVPLAELVRSVPDLRELGVADVRREPRRHRSLDASVRWSVDRLGTRAEVAFRRLGVWADSFCFASAVRVISDTGDRNDRDATRSFVELVEASLVRRTDDDRFSLPMAVRTFAQDELAADPDAATVRDRHAAVVADLVASAAAGLRAGGERTEPLLQLVDLDLPEIRAAVDWQLRRGRPELAADLVLDTYDHTHMRGRYGEFVAQCRAILAVPELDRADAGRVATAAALLSLMAGRVADSYDFAARALADADDPIVRAHAHLQRAWTGFFSGRLDGATVWADLDMARRIADQEGERELHAAQLLRGGALTVQARSIPEGRRLLADAATAAAELLPSHHVLAARLFSVYGTAVFDLRLDERLAEVTELVEDCRSVHHVAYQSMALATAGTIAALRSDLDRAGECFEEAERVTRERELPTFQNIAQRWRAFAHYRFELADALVQAERALELADATDNAWDLAAAHWLVGLLLLRQDDSRALPHLRAGRSGSIDPGYPFSLARSELALALVDLADGSFGLALDRVHDALQHSDAFGDLLGSASALDHLARLECEREAFERAGRLAGAADAIHRRAGISRLPCERDLRAAVEQQLGRGIGRDSARRAIGDGRELDAADAVRLARRSRGRRRRPVTGWDSLTPTERQVADLAAEGLTNPAIAGRLLMSVNTVKTHLSHVYAKVGVSGRSALAATRARRSTRT